MEVKFHVNRKLKIFLPQYLRGNQKHFWENISLDDL